MATRNVATHINRINVDELYSTGENFAELFESYVKSGEKTEGSVITGTIVAIENGDIVVGCERQTR